MTKNAGGVESVIMNYYRNINRNQIQFDFLCNGDGIAYSDEINELGGDIFYITPLSKNPIKYKKELKNFFKENSKKYDVIWVNVCALSNIDYLKYAKKYGINRRIIHSHNSQSIESKLKRIFHNINKNYVTNYSTDLWACSKEAGEYFFDQKRFNIINNAINLDDFKYDQEIRNKTREELKLGDKFVIGNVARFHFQKNHKFLIDIFYELVKKKPNSMLLLIGEGEDMPEIKKLVEELELDDKVLFLGKRSDINQLYQAMDVFILPSLFEGLPVVLVEAQASGIPVIASSEGIPENTKMVDNFTFVSLNNSFEFWSDIILNQNLVNKSELNIKLLKEKGFDINIESNKFMKMLVLKNEK